MSSQVRLISETGEHLGAFSIEKALEKSKLAELDLVEIGPNADPPIVKIMNFGHFKYELNKKERDQKKVKKSGIIKGIRLSPRIGKHDLEFRAKKAKKFLEEKNKVRIEMTLRGREKAHFDLARELINQFIEHLGEEVKIEDPIKRRGGKLSTIIAPGKD